MDSQHRISGTPGPWLVHHVAETGSTNADLLAAADSGEADHLSVLVTDHQLAGRGRLDRRWDAPAGSNLLVSFLFTEIPAEPAWLTQLVGLGVVDAIDRRCGTDRPSVGLKWPNDVLVDGRKLGGILAQRSPVSGAVVVGLGVNVGWAPAGAASLCADLALDLGPLEFLDEVLSVIDLESLSASDGSGLPDHYRRRLLTLGQQVRVELPGDASLTGTATGVDPAGRLVVEDRQGGVHVLDVGDVVHLRPA